MGNERTSKSLPKNFPPQRRSNAVATRPSAVKPGTASARPPAVRQVRPAPPASRPPIAGRAALRSAPTPPQVRPPATPTRNAAQAKRQTTPPRATNTQPRATNPNARQPAVQLFSSRVVQALKMYPNLHPGAVEPVAPGSVFRLNSFANQYRLHKVNSHSVNVPNQQYNFVRTREGEMLLHARYRHPSIAAGKQVLYAGEIFFNNGQLEWWSNGSGHYQPYAEDAEQANLPMDQFYSYQQVIKGEHKRKKG